MAKSKQYQIAFHLGAKVQSSFGKAFNSSEKHLTNLSKRLNKTQKRSKQATRSINSLSSSLNVLGKAAGVLLGIHAMKTFTSESIEAAKAQIEVETKLQAVLQNVKSLKAQGPEAYKAATRELMNHASEMQKLGVIGDEVTLAGYQQLATFQLGEKEIKTLSKGMLDLLAQQKGLNATQQDAVNIANMIGKAMNGQVGALSRVGITLTETQKEILKTGDQFQKAQVMAEILQQNVGGVNEELAKTNQGRIQQMTNAWGDMKEEIGKRILPLQARFAQWFMKYIPVFQRMAQGTIDAIGKGFDYVSRGFQTISSIASNIKQKFSSFKPTMNSVNRLIQYFKILGIQAFENIKQAIENNLPAFQNFKDTVMEIGGNVQNIMLKAFESMQPVIDWIINDGFPGFIDLLGAISDRLKSVYDFVKNNWTMISPIVYGIIGAFTAYKVITGSITIATNAFTFAMKAATVATKAFNAAITFATSPIGMVVIAIGALIAIGWAIVKNWDQIKAWFLKLWDNMMTIVTPVGEFFVKVFQKAYDGIVGIFSGIGEFFGGVFEGVNTSVKSGINLMIEAVNYVIGKINNISIKVPKWVPGYGGEEFGFSIPKIPMLAKGGIATAPTLAMVGEGREQEAILPLSKLENLLGIRGRSEPVQIVYSPQYHIQNGDEKTIRKVQKEDQTEFERKIKNLDHHFRRTRFV